MLVNHIVFKRERRLMSGVKYTSDALPKSPSAGEEFWQGVRDELPLMFGVIPFGLVFGVLGTESGLNPLQTILMSSVLFGGASQVVFVQLWAAGTPFFVIGSSVCVINIHTYCTVRQSHPTCTISQVANSAWLLADR